MREVKRMAAAAAVGFRSMHDGFRMLNGVNVCGTAIHARIRVFVSPRVSFSKQHRLPLIV